MNEEEPAHFVQGPFLVQAAWVLLLADVLVGARAGLVDQIAVIAGVLLREVGARIEPLIAHLLALIAVQGVLSSLKRSLMGSFR